MYYSATAKWNVLDSDTPKLSAAIASEDRAKWLHAVADECNTITSNNTWVYASSQPLGSNIFPSGVTLRIELYEHGNVSRYKARLVVRGNL